MRDRQKKKKRDEDKYLDAMRYTYTVDRNQ